MKKSRIFLTLCILTGVVGLTPAGGDVCYGILRPVSAVFFILAFASGVLEAAEADHERHAGPAPVASPEPQATRHEEFHGTAATAH